jgi:HEAT repeat protein
MDLTRKITSLLSEDAVEKRVAAAIVLGELKVKSPDAVAGLAKLLKSPVPLLQRHALEALTRIGAKKSLGDVFPLLVSSDADVRGSAARAVASVGEGVVPTIRKRMSTADPEMRRALDAILADLGGKEAFTTLLEGLSSGAGEEAKAAALAVRQKVKSATAAQRKGYLAETEKYLKIQKRMGGAETAVAAAIKILGFLEDERALPTLLAYATSEREPPLVRHEALIALRFALSKKSAAKVTSALVDAAASPDRALAQTALHTLGSLELDADQAKKLEKLVAHPDLERARFVIEHLGRQKGADAARVLVKLLASGDKSRAQVAAGALAQNDEPVPLLARALLEAKEPDRAWVLRNVLKPNAKKIAPAVRKQLLEAAVDELSAQNPRYEALLDIARDADPEGTAEALRALAQKLRKAADERALTIYGILCRSDRATDDDRYARAALVLARSGRDTRPAARAGDEALRQFGTLLDRGYDVARAMRSDKKVDLEQMYYVGFHFAEQGHPIGEELLGLVVKKGGRAKVARMAKNKLALAEQA